MFDLHFHFLLGCSISMTNHCYYTSQLHPRKFKLTLYTVEYFSSKDYTFFLFLIHNDSHVFSKETNQEMNIKKLVNVMKL